jgi:proteasome accessory factor A
MNMPDPQLDPIAGRLFGIETEYGILVEGRGAGDLMEESRRVVSAWPGVWAGPWDYRAEDPRRDMRGFRVDQLNYDHEDARLDRDRPGYTHLSGAEQRADRVLVNGARLYNDHGHPEYSTPECRSLRSLVAHDRAGERVLLECAAIHSRAGGREVRLFKNNSDLHGASYGCHEGYLVRRGVEFEALFHGMLPFLVTRILYAGAGKTGVETVTGAGPGPFADDCQYQLSQRADFFTEIASVDTLAKRPIFNTRDEAHADPGRFRRLHVICGDANLSQFATALKVGTTCLVLGLIESGWQPMFRLESPVDAIKAISRDPARRWLVSLEDGRTMRATDLQRIYLHDAKTLFAGLGGETDWVLREWECVLDDLERDPASTDDRLDWMAKRKLLESFIEAEGIWWEDPVLRSLDLEYHQIDPEQGLFYAVEPQMHRLVGEEEIERARHLPPPDTRAALRGELVRRFSRDIKRISWGRAYFAGGDEDAADQSISLAPEWSGGKLHSGAASRDEHLLSRLRAATTVPEILTTFSVDPVPPTGE